MPESKYKIISKTLDFILPPICVVSGKPVERQGTISSEIWAGLDFITEPLCKCCGRPFEFSYPEETLCGKCMIDPPNFTRARSALIYNDTSRKLILKFKHSDQTHLITTFIPWLKKAGSKLFEGADYLVPVPLHRWRLLKRRYNQSSIIALSLAKETGIPCLTDTLIRTSKTKSQGHMNSKQRQKNVSNAFTVPDNKKQAIKEKQILLIDDVFTTGATANECAKTLLKAGCCQVDILTIASITKS